MTTHEALILGIDSSTTACKAVVWDTNGQVVSSGRSNLTIQLPQPGWHEQVAESWWRALVRALRQALRGVEANRLAGLAIAHQRETFVPVDRTGQALRPGILWMDERAAGLLEEMERAVSGVDFHRMTGKPLSANLTAAKVSWLRAYEPKIFARTAHYLDVHAYLLKRLTGELVTGWGCADPTGLFDMTRHEWSADVLRACGVSANQLPPAHPPGSVIGRINRKAARATGLPVGLPVAAGLGDGQAGGVGANICAPGAAYLALGTSVISGSFSAKYVVDSAFRTMTGGDENSYLLETVLLGGTYTLDWLLKTFLGKRGAAITRTRAEMDRGLMEIPPGSDGLVLVPYWNTAMNPYWDASASGIVAGWRGNHRPAHFYRAILEGIAMELRLQFDGVEAALDRPLDRLVAMGGGAQSAGWCQIIADVLGKPVHRTAAAETAALGAGILAAVGAGLYATTAEAAAAMTHWEAQAFTPRPEEQTFYTQLYEEVYRPLYPALREPLHRLAEMGKIAKLT